MKIINSRPVRSASLSLMVLTTLAACGGGGGNAPAIANTPAAVEGIVYQADRNAQDVFDLYAVGSDTRLNPVLPANRHIIGFHLTPDRSAVLYLADQDIEGVYEIYRVNLAAPSVSVKISSPMPTGRTVSSFKIAANGSTVVYIANQESDDTYELYSVSMNAPGISTKLNAALVADGDVAVAEFAPDGSVVYAADQDTEGQGELYRVELANPGVSTKLNGALVAGGSVQMGSPLRFLPDGSGVAYRADRDTNDVYELYLSRFANPGVSVKLNGSLTGNGDVMSSYKIIPDGSGVVYLADQSVNDRNELYMVRFDVPGVSTRLNTLFPVSRDVLDFELSPHSQGAVYLANQDDGETNELYYAAFNQPGISTKLNPALVAGGDVRSGFSITPDTLSVVYRADQDTDNQYELYRVDFASLGVSTKLNGVMTPGGSAGWAHVAGNGSGILYIADQDTDNQVELFRVNFASPGNSIKLNGVLADPSRDVVDFVAEGLVANLPPII